MSIGTVPAFLHGARALIANYRGQTGRRQGTAVSSEGSLDPNIFRMVMDDCPRYDFVGTIL